MNNQEKVTGRSLLRAATSVLLADRELLTLPIIGALATALATAPVVLIYLFIPDSASAANWVAVALITLIATFTTTLFAVALADGANLRMEGNDPTMRSSLERAWARRTAILQWSLIATALGLLLRLIEQRFAFAGRLISALGNLTWVIASYFAIPVLAVESGSGFDAVKRSATIIQQRWGKALRIGVRVAIIQLVLVFVVVAFVFTGVGMFESNPVLGVALIAIGVLILLVGAFLISAIASVARVALYRYATGRSVPGFDEKSLESAVTRGKL